MASVVDEREDSLLESHRTSLLDIIEDRNRTLNKKTLLHRAVFISKIYHQNFQEIGHSAILENYLYKNPRIQSILANLVLLHPQYDGIFLYRVNIIPVDAQVTNVVRASAEYYEKFFRDVQNQYQVEGVTGLLLLFPKHCIHVVETSQEIVLEVIRDLISQSQDPTLHMEKSKILIVSHNIPHRLYQHWSHRVLDIEAPRLDDYDPTEDPEKLVSDMLTQLLKLGTHLARQPKVSLKNAMDALHESRPELLPQQVVLAYLLEAENMPCVMEPEGFRDLYEQPFDVTLASEKVWPMPVRLFQYNYNT